MAQPKTAKVAQEPKKKPAASFELTVRASSDSSRRPQPAASSYCELASSHSSSARCSALCGAGARLAELGGLLRIAREQIRQRQRGVDLGDDAVDALDLGLGVRDPLLQRRRAFRSCCAAGLSRPSSRSPLPRSRELARMPRADSTMRR